MHAGLSYPTQRKQGELEEGQGCECSKPSLGDIHYLSKVTRRGSIISPNSCQGLITTTTLHPLKDSLVVTRLGGVENRVDVSSAQAYV